MEALGGAVELDANGVWDEDWQIVFLHGLEGGPFGRKSLFLKKCFGTSQEPIVHRIPTNAVVDDSCPDQHARIIRTQVLTPDLEMSVYDVWKQNSVPRKWFRLERCLEGCAATAEAAIAEIFGEEGTGASGSEPGGETEVTGGLCREQVDAGRRECPPSARRKFLLVGSSWGGATAIKLLERNRIAKPDKVLLFAPALGAHGRVWGAMWPEMEVTDDFFARLGVGSSDDTAIAGGGSNADGKSDAKKFMTLVHGDADDTCPTELSRRLAERFPVFVEYIEVPGGDHRLNQALRIPKCRLVEGRLEALEKEWGGPAFRDDFRQVVLNAIVGRTCARSRHEGLWARKDCTSG